MNPYPTPKGTIMRLVNTVEIVVDASNPVPSKDLIRSTPLIYSRRAHFRELRDMLRRMERDGKFEKHGRYTLTYSDSLSYALCYFGK
jgi:hypothetical protein